jgi:small subunit ribosomal protein S11
MAQATKKTAKKRVVKVEAEGYVYVKATFNNIIISYTNKAGQVISWSSAGKCGFRGTKAYEAGLRRAEVFVKGPGGGRESAIRTIGNAGIEVTVIRDVTPLPHNGCRPPKKRRV